MEPKKKTSGDPRFDNAYLAFVDDLRGVIWRWIGRELITEREAAVRAGLHPKTVINFLTGVTMAPQLPTLFKLTRAAGASFTIEEEGKAPRLVKTRKTRQRTSR